MRKSHKKRTLTFGDFIVTVWDACGREKARKVVRYAVNTQLVVFRKNRRFVVP